MKTGIVVLLVALFSASAEGMVGGDFPVTRQVVARGAASEKPFDEACDELENAHKKDKQDDVIKTQPIEELKKDEKYCVPVNRCMDFCCERYFKMTWVACSLFLIRDGIALGLL